MSVARFGINGGHFYSNVASPMKIDLNFVVDASNGNGLGIRSLKSNGFVKSVFMHTSATPGVVDGVTNPNPAVGYALIQLKQNYNVYLGGFTGFVAPVSTSTKIDNAALTVGNPYVITTLGDATLAKWVSIGVPAGVTPAVGVAFIASSTGGSANVSTSRVMVPGVSGITNIEVIGDTKLTSNSSIAANGGQFVLVQFVNAGTVAAPAAGSVVGMSMFFDGSSVTVDGL